MLSRTWTEIAVPAWRSTVQLHPPHPARGVSIIDESGEQDDVEVDRRAHVTAPAVFWVGKFSSGAAPVSPCAAPRAGMISPGWRR